MKTFSLRNHISQFLNTDRPPSAGHIDFEIRALGGGKTSILMLNELPPKSTVTERERMLEIKEEIVRLRGELNYYKAVTDEVLLRIIPMVQLHCHGLHAAVEKAKAGIIRAPHDL